MGYKIHSPLDGPSRRRLQQYPFQFIGTNQCGFVHTLTCCETYFSVTSCEDEDRSRAALIVLAATTLKARMVASALISASRTL